MAKQLHPKIKELKLRAKPVEMSGSYVDAEGNLISIDFKVKAEDEDRTLKGYLAVWGVKDDAGTVAIRGCFSKSIQERGPESDSKYKIVLLWQHQMSEPIGRFTKLVEDDYGLYFEAEIDDVPQGNRALTQYRSGTLNQFSYGFEYVWDKMEYREEDDAVLMYECKLWEGTACTLGRNQETYAIRSVEQYEDLLEAVQEELDEVIKEIPRSKQLEVRSALSRYISLASNKPIDLYEKLLEKNSKPKPEDTPKKGIELNNLFNEKNIFLT